MIEENLIRAKDINVLPQKRYYETRPTTKLFKLFVDEAATHILRAPQQQKMFANLHRRSFHFNFK